MNPTQNKRIFIVMLMFCVSALLFAFFVEYGLKHVPCNLCLMERLPYIATIIISSLVLFFDKYEKIALIVIGLFFIFGTIISFYHFGIEQGFFSESLICNLKNENKIMTTKELLKVLETKTISCKDVTFSIYGISLATFNTIFSFTISAIMFRLSINYEKNK